MSKIIAANAKGHAGKWHHTNAWDKPAADISERRAPTLITR